ncbi:unnamed protein product [Amaranthus hypochondriacus]
MASDHNKTKNATCDDWRSPRTPNRRRSSRLERNDYLSSVFTHEFEASLHIGRDIFLHPFPLFEEPLLLAKERHSLQRNDISVYPTDICSQSKNTTQQGIDVALEEFKKLQLNKEKKSTSDLIEDIFLHPFPLFEEPLLLAKERHSLQRNDISVYPTDICSQSKNTTQQGIDVALEEFKKLQLNKEKKSTSDLIEDIFLHPFPLFEEPLLLAKERHSLQRNDISVYPTYICSQSKNTTQQGINVTFEEFKKLQLNKEKMNSSDLLSRFLIKRINSTKSNGSMPPPKNSKELLQEIWPPLILR